MQDPGWLVWLVPVNVSSILLYATTDAWAFVFLYTLYLVNAWSGWRVWMRELRRAEPVTDVTTETKIGRV